MELSLGDKLLWHIFCVLELHRGADEIAISDVASIYFDRTDFRDLDYMRRYMTGLCERVFKMVNQMLANGYRVQTDEERRQRRAQSDEWFGPPE